MKPMAVKDTKDNEIISTVIRIFIWCLTYALLVFFIRARIQSRYGISMEEAATKNAVGQYYMTIGFVLIITAGFSIAWWLMALLGRAQYYFERYTILITVLFIFLFSVITVAVCISNRISRYADVELVLYYGFAFIPTFCFNIFCFPPKAVQIVLLGENFIRWILGIAMMFLTVLIIIWG